MAEGVFINKSLTTLGRVLRMVKETQQTGAPNNIPFRESKLTRIL